MKIFIEGQNATGKSTLARILCEKYNLKYIKENKPDRPGFQYYIEKLISYDDNIMVDRFALGEIVYPVLFKDGRVPLRKYQQQAIDRIINNLGGVLIYASASPEFIKHTFETRGEEALTFEESFIERDLFNVALRSCIIDNFINYSPEFDELQRAEFFDNLDLMVKNNCMKFRNFKGNGSYNSKVMLIGEQFNEKTKLENKFAFSDYKGSSDYLAKTLYLLHERVYLTNALNNPFLMEEIQLIKPEIIISLGNKSSKKLTELNVAHFHVPHPQFWKRFYHQDIRSYVYKFKDILKNKKGIVYEK